MWFFSWLIELGLRAWLRKREDQSYAHLEIDCHRFPADYAERRRPADSGTIVVIDNAGIAACNFDNLAARSSHHDGSGG